MTYIDSGVSSAKRATWRQTDWRPILMRIVKENPTASTEQICERFWEEVREDLDQLKGIVFYVGNLGVRALTPKHKKRTGSAHEVEVKKAVAIMKTKIKKRIAEEARLLLLDLITPNGKPLRNCTGQECRALGSWYAQLGQKVPANKTVGNCLSENQVYRLWKASNK
jgi:hypothetical protein